MVRRLSTGGCFISTTGAEMVGLDIRQIGDCATVNSMFCGGGTGVAGGEIGGPWTFFCGASFCGALSPRAAGPLTAEVWAAGIGARLACGSFHGIISPWTTRSGAAGKESAGTQACSSRGSELFFSTGGALRGAEMPARWRIISSLGQTNSRSPACVCVEDMVWRGSTNALATRLFNGGNSPSGCTSLPTATWRSSYR